MEDKVTLLLDRLKTLEIDRSPWESQWQEIADYVVPRKGDFTVMRTPGEKRNQNIYDSSAQRGLVILAAALHGWLSSPSVPWFSLKTKDRELMKNRAAKLWIADLQDATYDVFNRSNFNTEIDELYLDTAAFGTGVFYEEEDNEDIARFDAIPLSQCFVAESRRGRIDTLFRKFSFTARQCNQQWGKDAGPKVATEIEAKKFDKTFEILHAVYPRQDYDTSKKDSVNMPWASCYLEIKGKHLIRESGYEDFPFMVPRWLKFSSGVYGSSPAMDALADVKMLNAMSKTTIKAAQKLVDPPLVLPHKGFILPLKTTPGGLNYKTSQNPKDKIEPLITGQNIPIAIEMEEQRRKAIAQAFFVDLFLMLVEKPDMTATEVLERVEEKMIILGPTLGRFIGELLDPGVERTVKLVAKSGKLNPPPRSLMGKEYTIEYVSPLARAQKKVLIAGVSRLVATTFEVAKVQPEVVDKLDGDRIIDLTGEIYGVPPDLLRDEDTIKGIREGRAQAEAEMAKRQQGQELLAGMKDASSAVKNMQGMNGAGAGGPTAQMMGGSPAGAMMEENPGMGTA